MKLLAAGYEGSASIEHWGSRWLMLEGSHLNSPLIAPKKKNLAKGID